MAWIEFHIALRDHWKVKRLAGLLGMEYAHALGHLACLWCWAAQNSPKGNLADFSDQELCEAARISATVTLKVFLKQVRLLDANDRIHDWGKHGLKLLESTRKRVREHRLRKRNCNVTVTPTLPNQPNQPNQPNNNKGFFEIEHFKDQKFQIAFKDYLEMRKRIRKPATERAKVLVLRELEKHDLNTAVSMLEQSILNSWQGVFPLKNQMEKGLKPVSGSRDYDRDNKEFSEKLKEWKRCL